MLYKVQLNGADPEKIAGIMGGTLIMHDLSDDKATIADGDIEKLRRYELQLMNQNHLPQYDQETDGDYSNWLVANNMD